MGTNTKPQKKTEKSLLSRKNISDFSKAQKDKMKVYGDTPDPRPRIKIYLNKPKKKKISTT